MMISFSKAVASGNDFIIVDNRENKLAERIADFEEFAKVSCKRRFSVGADGLLVLEDSGTADFRMRIFNPDGSEVSMCGNGIRCSALYSYAKGWCGSSMKIETGAGVLEAKVEEGYVRIKMVQPKDIKLGQNIGVGRTFMNVHKVNTGVPHVVHFVTDIQKYPVKEMGSKIRYHTLFAPDGTNVDFVEGIDKSTISARTYERGVEDETLACGTGVVASALISHLIAATEQPVNVITKSDEVLKVYFKKDRNNFYDVYLEGKAHIVFEGDLTLS
ncbi:MAG: diaminopimelate epimerase [Omnitrophica bacterium RBG_13_46_9]|nr:MAG: diaminopimelate epimerase [Omnitrophica bacterium RBG_13_46_9]